MGLLFYKIFLQLYRAGIFVAAKWNLKAKLWHKGQQRLLQQIGLAMKGQPAGEVLWMHCASLGEFEQGRPVLEHLKKTHPEIRVVLTFFSSSGYERTQRYTGADHIFYLPFDAASSAAEFIDLIKPTLVIWVKYEYWYYYLSEIKKRNIPLLLISAIFFRKQLFFRWYGGFYRKILTCFTHLFVQTPASLEMLASIGITGNVSVSGDTRFDRVTDVAATFEPIAPVEQFCGNHRVVVAGSTWEDDEEVLDHFANTHPDIRFIIAPHEIDPEHVQGIQKLFKRVVLYSALTGPQADPRQTPVSPPQEANVLIIDNIGMLSRLYRYATITYVGGGFGATGVHNLLEAAVYGKPVVFGPVYDKFAEAKELVENGGGFSIGSALELEQVFSLLLNSATEYNKACETARNYVYAKKGAKDVITEYIANNRFLTRNDAL